MPELDLTLASLYRVGGKSPPEMPGLAAPPPPRRPAHGRERDRLVIYFALGGNAPLSPRDYDILAAQTADKFYGTPGSLTLALKTAAEAANAVLLDANMRTTGHGLFAMAVFALAALRADQLYLVQSGPVHAFWLSAAAGARHYFEPQLAGRGLGFSQTPRLHFAHMTLGPGDRLVLAAQMPSEWENWLMAERGAGSLETTRRHLLSSAAPDMHAALIHSTAGTGKITVLPPPPTRPVVQPAPGEPVEGSAPVEQHALHGAAAAAAASLDLPASSEETGRRAAPAGASPSRPAKAGDAQAGPPPPHPETQDGRAQAGIAHLAAFTAADVPSVMPELPPGVVPPTSYPLPPNPQDQRTRDAADLGRRAELVGAGDREGSLTAGPTTVASSPVPVMARQPVSGAPKKRRGQGVFLALATALRSTRLFFAGLGARISAFLPRLLPGMEEDQMGKPGSAVSRTTLLVIAIAVPVLIASVAAAVYLQRGRAAQFQTYYARAGEQAGQAVAATDPVLQRQYWLSTLQLLDQAESYARSPDSQALRAQAQNSLDALDRITRLDYQNALSSGLDGTVTRMAATDSDVYMLQGATGEVLHAARSELGYSLDEGFQCSPGTYDSLTVGPPVDLAVLPANSALGAEVIAVDAAGNGLYCAPDQAPRAFQLAPPPQPLQQVTAITLEGNTLFVLDAPGRAIWQYAASQSGFDTTPVSFFGLEVPPVETATDMAVLDTDLFLLHSDGHLTTCTLSLIPDVAPTRCTDPATLVDTRSGNPSDAALSGASFSQISGAPLPTSSVALLDGAAQAIYRFSPGLLELQDQLRASPASPVPQGVPATAFTVSPNHIVFLAVGENLYFAQEP